MLDNARALGETMLGARLVDLDWSLLFMLGLFLVFAFLLTKLITRPVMASQEQRYASMEGARKAAAAAEIVAAETQLTYERQLSTARHGAVEVRDRLRDAGLSASRTTLESVRAEVATLVAAADVELAAAAGKARADMKGHAEELATALSLKLVKPGGGKA